MESSPFLRYIVVGRLSRDYILTPDGKAYLDKPGGSLLYAASGAGIWEPGIGLVGRVGEDYPQDWIEQASRAGFDTSGVRFLNANLDLRAFYAYTDMETCHNDNPVSHFARLGLSFPKMLLGYTGPSPAVDSRIQQTPLTIRQSDLPGEYLDATAAHLCPLDFLSHTLLPTALRQGRISTITIDPASGYMNPIFWDHIPAVVKGITALITSEDKLRNLFQGRSTDLWEMAETIAGYGCEMVVIKRGSQGQLLLDRSNQAGPIHWQIPAYPARVIDPTGAGQAFCGGFLTGFRSTYNALEGALAGNISASLTIEGNGPFYALDTMPGLAHYRMDALRDMVRKV
jgi:sugar/nucleoside kinase (ribokinase family)